MHADALSDRLSAKRGTCGPQLIEHLAPPSAKCRASVGRQQHPDPHTRRLSAQIPGSKHCARWFHPRYTAAWNEHCCFKSFTVVDSATRGLSQSFAVVPCVAAIWMAVWSL